jgi:hypothetical protein
MRRTCSSVLGPVTFTLVSLVLWAGLLVSPEAAEDEPLRNVGFAITPREVLFFSAPAGQWTSVRLDAGERVLQRGAHGNVAAVVTSQRAIGFSGPLNVTHEVSVSDEETLETFKAEGNVVTFVTRRRVFGFSAFIGKWSVIDRFQLGR